MLEKVIVSQDLKSLKKGGDLGSVDHGNKEGGVWPSLMPWDSEPRVVRRSEEEWSHSGQPTGECERMQLLRQQAAEKAGPSLHSEQEGQKIPIHKRGPVDIYRKDIYLRTKSFTGLEGSAQP